MDEKQVLDLEFHWDCRPEEFSPNIRDFNFCLELLRGEVGEELAEFSFFVSKSFGVAPTTIQSSTSRAPGVCSMAPVSSS